jgi:hypothetical protein
MDTPALFNIDFDAGSDDSTKIILIEFFIKLWCTEHCKHAWSVTHSALDNVIHISFSDTTDAVMFKLVSEIYRVYRK